MRTIRADSNRIAAALALGLILAASVPAWAGALTPGLKDALASSGPDDLHVDKVVGVGDGSTDVTLDWVGVAGAAGYHVLHSQVAAFDAAVDLTGRTTGATTLTVADGDTTLPALTFFQVRATNACNQESP